MKNIDFKDLLLEEQQSIQVYQEMIADSKFSDRIFNSNLSSGKAQSDNINFNKANTLGPIGKLNRILKTKDAAYAVQKAQALLDERELTHSGNSESNGYDLLVYTSPKMKLCGKEVNVIFGQAPNSGYSLVTWPNNLSYLLAAYDYTEKDVDKLLASGVQYLYEDNKVTTDKNYNWIAEKWLNVKDVYAYCVYTKTGWWVYIDIEVDLTKLKGLEDFMSKKSIGCIARGFQLSTGRVYIYNEIINGKTKLRDITKI